MEINLQFTEGTVQGTCPKCEQPVTGHFDCEKKGISVSCVNCHFKITGDADSGGFVNVRVQE